MGAGASALDKTLENAKASGVLTLAEKDLKAIPELEAVKAALTLLDLSQNASLGPQLSGFTPAEFALLATLKLQGCELAALPRFQKCKIEELDLSINKLTGKAVDASFSGMFFATLKRLDLYDNPMGTMPKSIWGGGFTSLALLDLRRCGIANFKLGSVACIPQLDTLLLDGNQLETIDEKITGACPLIGRVGLEDNKITSIPESLLKCGKLNHLDLKGNGLTLEVFSTWPGASNFLQRREKVRKSPENLFSDHSQSDPFAS